MHMALRRERTCLNVIVRDTYLLSLWTVSFDKIHADISILPHTDMKVGAVLSDTNTPQEEGTCWHLQSFVVNHTIKLNIHKYLLFAYLVRKWT